MKTTTTLLLLIGILVTPAAAQAPEGDTVAIVGGLVKPVTSEPIPGGVVLIRGKKIVAVGTAEEVKVPKGARIIDATGHHVLPGFIEPHNHSAITDFNDVIYQVNPQFRVLDNIVVKNDAMKMAVAGGVTTALAIPGSGANLAGWGVILKTWADSPKEALVRYPGALKIAQAGNPERRNGDLGAESMGMNFLLRQVLTEGREYHRAWEKWEKTKKGKRPVKNPRYEPFRALFRKEVPVAVHTQIMSVVQSTMRMLHDEFGLRVVIVHGTFDGFKNGPEIAKRNIPVANGPRQVWYDSTQGKVIGLTAAWYWAGIGEDNIAVNTDDAGGGMFPGEELTFHGTVSIRLGLPESAALRGQTINVARMLGIDDRVGSLEPGKDADVAIWTGDPFDPRNRTQVVLVNGKVAYDAARDGIRF